MPYERGRPLPCREDRYVEDMDVDGVAFISSDREDRKSSSSLCRPAQQTPPTPAALLTVVRSATTGPPSTSRMAERTWASSSPCRELSVLDHIHGTAPARELNGVYNVFADNFNKGAGTADSTPFTSYAYDAAWLVIYGSAWAHYNEAAIDGLGIARGLRRISEKRDGTTQVDVGRSSWNSVRAEFEAAQPIDVQGASGALDYDPNTGETSAPIEYWCVTSLAGEDLTFAVVNHPSEGVSRCEI